MESLRDVRLFARVVNVGNFSAAGRQCGLSPAAVSRRISMLEQSLGVRLIYRTSRKLTLTEAGQTLFENAVKILNQVDELQSVISEYQQSPRGLLHVHTRVTIGVQFLAKLLPEFQALYPEVQVKLWLTEDHKDLIENKIDVAIRLGNLDEPSLAVRRLWDGSPRMLLASPDYIARHPPITHPSDLARHNCLTYLDGRFDDGRALWRFKKGTEDTEVRVTGTLQVNNPEVLRQSTLAGAGICLLPLWCFDDDLEKGRIVPLLTSYAVTPSTFDHHISVVFEKSRYVSPKVRAFVDYLAGSESLFKPQGGAMPLPATAPENVPENGPENVPEKMPGKMRSRATAKSPQT
jgi:DNA-binding transcriptional LysR family regulator